jgi:hypothetical protein
MNRRMIKPYEEREEKLRRSEYSEILVQLPYSEVIGRCDAEDDSAYPGRILKWQYEEGLLNEVLTGGDKTSGVLSGVDSKTIIERRSEFARRLALFLVAEEAYMSREYLRKLCKRQQGERRRQATRR